MTPLIVFITAFAFIIASLWLDTKADAHRFAQGIRINHSFDFAIWFIFTMSFVVGIHAIAVAIVDIYCVNSRLLLLLGMWVVQYVAMRWLLFDRWLNVMRGLPIDYQTKETGKQASFIDQKVKVPVRSFYRIAAVVISSFFLIVTFLDYFEVYHSNLTQNVGIALFIGIAVFGVFFTWKNKQ